MIEILLTWAEVWMVAHVSLLRSLSNLKARRKDRVESTAGLGLDAHFLGCLGECALAKHRGKFWSGSIGDFSAADVSISYQVRGCARVTDCLTLHPEDDDDEPFISALVTREDFGPLGVRVKLRGWMLAREGKQHQHWRADVPLPAYFVRAAYLHAMETLP